MNMHRSRCIRGYATRYAAHAYPRVPLKTSSVKAAAACTSFQPNGWRASCARYDNYRYRHSDGKAKTKIPDPNFRSSQARHEFSTATNVFALQNFVLLWKSNLKYQIEFCVHAARWDAIIPLSCRHYAKSPKTAFSQNPYRNVMTIDWCVIRRTSQKLIEIMYVEVR